MGLAEPLAEVDLAGLDVDRPADLLSGDQVTRVRLAGLVARAAEVLLLDEPTNNLDAETSALVACVLRGWNSGAVVVSHDRAPLRELDGSLERAGLRGGEPRMTLDACVRLV
jgi:ATPase subunit of ABC transporter with duplicated ATPase domains